MARLFFFFFIHFLLPSILPPLFPPSRSLFLSFTFPSPFLSTAFQGRISFSYERVIQLELTALSLARFPPSRRWLFLSFRHRGRSHHRGGAAIYTNILDNKSRRVIYEVFPRTPAWPRTAFRAPPCSLKINNADGDRRCNAAFMSPRLRN